MDDAVAFSQAAINQGCSKDVLAVKLREALSKLTAKSVVGKAVLARLVGNFTGETGTEPDVNIAPSQDLVAEVAKAASGATLHLSEGTYQLASTLVLLDGISLVGSGQTATKLESSAPDAAVLVMAPTLVSVSKLSIARKASVPGSVVIVSSATSIKLEGVRLSGARSDKAGRGGAGVDLTGSATAKAATDTTAQLTDVDLVDNSSTGLAVGPGQKVSVVESRFTGNGDCGACFLTESGGSIVKSTFSHNGIAIAATGTAAPVLKANDISGSTVGIQVTDVAAPSISGTRIAKAKRAGVIFAGKSSGVLADTACVKLKIGIALSKTAAPSLKRNDSCLIVQAKK